MEAGSEFSKGVGGAKTDVKDLQQRVKFEGVNICDDFRLMSRTY